ncbi:hypothetical protein SteCoe_21754 [Stentor coeruleus]|uniref:Uncharacterized protein n=1 Tax=Stentor coeruleus TaxID=5963 RepID=A0A1R2BNT1_9CILI|nr:hypothetical protein SteCoe_21754 [Stentor coeruleus]
MIGDSRLKIFIKVAIDSLFIILFISIFFVEVFKYMDDYYVTTLSIIKQTDYKISLTNEKTPLTQMIIASYSDFNDKFCGQIKDPQVDPVCDKRKDFETAGILFLTFSSISVLFTIYGIFSLFGVACGCSCCGFLKFYIVHYIYPGIYALALVLYITVSEIFTLDVPDNFDDDYKMKVHTGLILMFGAQFVSIVSVVFYFFNRTQLKSLVLIAQGDYVPVKD